MKRVIIGSSSASATNNVKRVCNYFQVGRPMYVDRCALGYRVNAASFSNSYVKDPETAQSIVDEIRDELGIECVARIRRGYSKLAGTYDIIIPVADDDEVLNYEYR